MAGHPRQVVSPQLPNLLVSGLESARGQGDSQHLAPGQPQQPPLQGQGDVLCVSAVQCAVELHLLLVGLAHRHAHGKALDTIRTIIIQYCWLG